MEPFIGQIMMFAGNFAPRGWAFCDGQLLPINQNQALYSILGTIYGGDGRTTFGLPDLRGRAPIHEGQGPGLSARRLGQRGGSEQETLTVANIPSHAHNLATQTGDATDSVPGNRVFAEAAEDVYADGAANGANSGAVTATGGGQAHNNMPPFLAVSYVIALVGVFPSRS